MASPSFLPPPGKGHVLWSDLALTAALLVSLLLALILGLVSTGDVVLKNERRDVLQPEDAASIFSGQFFVWTCVFLAFYTAGNDKCHVITSWAADVAIHLTLGSI